MTAPKPLTVEELHNLERHAAHGVVQMVDSGTKTPLDPECLNKLIAAARASLSSQDWNAAIEAAKKVIATAQIFHCWGDKEISGLDVQGRLVEAVSALKRPDGTTTVEQATELEGLVEEIEKLLTEDEDGNWDAAWNSAVQKVLALIRARAQRKEVVPPDNDNPTPVTQPPQSECETAAAGEPPWHGSNPGPNGEGLDYGWSSIIAREPTGGKE